MPRRLLRLALLLARLAQVCVLSLICLPPLLVSGLLDPSTGPRVLRWYFVRCGGAYVKIGQLLASRYDLLPARYCEELSQLLYALRPVPADRIRRIVERELAAPVGDLFRSFDDVPIATASLAQVHDAVLPGGERVVVKVLKPGVEEQVRIDLICFRLTGRVLDTLPLLRGVDVRFVVADLSRSMLDEMDFHREALNTSYLHGRMAADPIAHRAPAVHRSHSGRRVLTLERIDGVTVREIIAALDRGDTDALRAWAAQGITPRRTAIVLFRSVLEQAIRLRVFNADPHPSNLIVMPGGALAWVDFGLVGWVDERQWEIQLQLREALTRGRVHEAYLALLRAIEPLPQNRDLRGFEQEVKRGLRDYLLAAEDTGSSLAHRSSGVFLMNTIRALRRHRLPIAASTVALYRTILIADMVVLRLYPEIDWLGHMRRFLADLTPDLLRDAVEEPLTSTAVLYRLARTPQAVSAAVDWVADRLPQLGRSTLATLTFWQRLSLAGLRLLRVGTVLAGIAIAATIVTPGDPVGADPPSLIGLIMDNPWLALLGCVMLILVLGSLIRRSEST